MEGPASAMAKPRLRGRIHQVGAAAWTPVGAALVLEADGPRATAGATVFALGVLSLFTTSASYHLGRWSERGRRRMRRLDHSAIFVLIASSYTPICLVKLSGWVAPAALGAAWVFALTGVGLALGGIAEKRGVGLALYLTLGWLSVLTIPQLLSTLSVLELAMLVAGGVLYTVGAIVLATRRPDPWPATFGYHEVWHSFTVLAVLCHAFVVWRVVR